VSNDVTVAIERKRGPRALAVQEGRGERAFDSRSGDGGGGGGYGGGGSSGNAGDGGGGGGPHDRLRAPIGVSADGAADPRSDAHSIGRESGASSDSEEYHATADIAAAAAAAKRSREKAYLGPGGQSDDVGWFHSDRIRRFFRRCAALDPKP